jgi:hypothetical protein
MELNGPSNHHPNGLIAARRMVVSSGVPDFKYGGVSPPPYEGLLYYISRVTYALLSRFALYAKRHFPYCLWCNYVGAIWSNQIAVSLISIASRSE